MTILPELYVRKPRREGLRVIPLYDPVPRHSVGLARLPQRHVGKAAEALMEMCRTTLNGFRQGRQARAS
jgi:DNA-binding transcriptional LysR family regulator